MMESDKELMKNDIIMVTKISLQIDYSNRTKVKEIYDALTEREILKTSIGNNYLKRLEKIYHGEEPNHTCVICDQESGDNPIICKKCLSKIQIVRNETESGKEEVFQTEDRKNLQEEANKGIEKGMKLLNEQIKNADKFVSDTAKVVNEKSNKVIQTINEKSIVKNPISSKKKKWIWVISILFGCYIISKAFGLDSSINEDDMITLIGQNVSDTTMTKKMDTTTIGGRIKKRRNDLGLSQENLAEKLFTSKQMISSYENNKTELKIQVVKELAIALGTTSSFLIDGNEAVTYKQETAELVALFNSISKEEVRKIAIEQLRLLTRIHIQQ